MKTLTVNSVDIFDDYAETFVLNNSANYELDCLDGLTVTFEVTIDDSEDPLNTHDFTIQMQSTERNNGMMAYNGYEMTCDGEADESQELIEYMGYDESFLGELYEQAKKHSKSVLENLLDK